MEKFLQPRFIAAFLFLFMHAAPGVFSQDSSFTGQVVAISDGDTIKVMHAGAPETIRLSGIDCPEKSQAFGTLAKQFSSGLCYGKTVTVLVKTRDRYGRSVADVVLPDGKTLSHELLSAGYAWWYRKYSPHDTNLEQMEADARQRHAGLWADPAAQPPWSFRQANRSKKSKFYF